MTGIYLELILDRGRIGLPFEVTGETANFALIASSPGEVLANSPGTFPGALENAFDHLHIGDSIFNRRRNRGVI